MKHENDDSRSRTCSTLAPRGVASSNRNRAAIGFPLISLLWLLAFLGTAAAPSAPFSNPSPPVATFRVYRAIDSRLLGGSLGDAGTRLGNTNAGSAGGVLGYLHSEVIPSFAVSGTGRRRPSSDVT